MCMEVTFLGNNETNEPQNVNKLDHVQKDKTKIITEAENICGLANYYKRDQQLVFQFTNHLQVSILVILTNFMNSNKTF